MDRPDDTWIRIGEQMPREVGDIGFSLVLHPRDPDTAWVIPMDGPTVWSRVSPGGRPVVDVSRHAVVIWLCADGRVRGEPGRLGMNGLASAWHGGAPCGR